MLSLTHLPFSQVYVVRFSSIYDVQRPRPFSSLLVSSGLVVLWLILYVAHGLSEANNNTVLVVYFAMIVPALWEVHIFQMAQLAWQFF